jgi:hypothetical protein
MKFLLRPDALARARPPVRAFLGFAALLVAATVAQRAVQGGLTPAALALSFADVADGPGGVFGSMAIWEQVHAGAFVYGFLLLTLGSLLVVCPVAGWLRSGLLAVGVAAALGDMLLPFLAARCSWWAVLRVASFALVNAALLISIAVAWVALQRAAGAGRDA